jgi:hypothetical protein
VFRWLRRRKKDADPAEELRAKLEESRAVAEDRDEFEAGETPVDEADPEARRRAVHERTRARIDELSRDGGDAESS